MSQPLADQAAQLRDARSADLPILLALEAHFPGDRLSLRQFRHHVHNRKAALRVVEIDDALAGYSLLLTRQRSPAARLYSLVVSPVHRGRGLGRTLLDDVVAECRTRQCTELYLEVRADNDAAIRLYQGFGFHFHERRARYYHDDTDALRLRLDLTS